MRHETAELSPNVSLIGVPGSRNKLSTPSLVLDLDIVEQNIKEMIRWTTAAGLRLRPHAKTHKSVAIAKILGTVSGEFALQLSLPTKQSLERSLR